MTFLPATSGLRIVVFFCGAAIALASPDRPMIFEQNIGQTDTAVRYLARAGGYTLYLTDRDAVMALGGERGVLRMSWKGGARSPVVEGVTRLESYSNYYIGNDPTRWRERVPHFASVRYTDVYPGIDMVYYGSDRQAEYDFVVAPGADPGQIRLAFSGHDKLWTTDTGDLAFRAGAQELRLRRPRVYQEHAGRRVEVQGGYEIDGAGGVRFALADYDRGRALVIDPVFEFFHFLGGPLARTHRLSESGRGQSTGDGVVVDSTGAVYVGGRTDAIQFPVTQGVAPGGIDLYLTKFTSDGRAILYSIYFGGSGEDWARPRCLALDGQNNIYFSGGTESADFPTTAGAIDRTFRGATDGFVAKFGPTGSLAFSTYLDSIGAGVHVYVAVDSAGFPYLAGDTFNVPSGRGFVAKLAPDGKSTLYVTYLSAYATNIAVDSLGQAYVTGNAYGAITILGPVDQTTFGGGDVDVYVAKISATGALVFSTYLGGNGDDQSNGIAVDSTGAVYVCGVVWGRNGSTPSFPTTAGALRTTYSGGISDGFVAKFNPNGSRSWVTLLGGNDYDWAMSLAVQPGGTRDVYVTGLTDSPDFPAPLGQVMNPRGSSDIFVVKLSPDGKQLRFANNFGGTFGGSRWDTGYDVAVKGTDVYLTGAVSTGFTPDTARQPLYPFSGGDFDAFVAKLSNVDLQVTPSPVRRLPALPRAPSGDPAGQLTLFDCEIEARNISAPTATNTRVVATPGAGNQLLSCEASGASCSVSNSQAVISAGNLDSNSAVEVHLQVLGTVTSGGATSPCSFEGRSNINDPNEANNYAETIDNEQRSAGQAGLLVASTTPGRADGNATSAPNRLFVRGPGDPGSGVEYTAARTYAPGAQVAIRAQAAPGCAFADFTGTLPGETTSHVLSLSNPMTLTMGATPAVVVARFRCLAWRDGGQPLMKIGLFREFVSQPAQPGQPWGMFLLDATGEGGWNGDQLDRLFWLGTGGDVPVTGDWNGDGRTKIGIFRNGLWLLDVNGNGRWDGDSVDRIVSLGQAGDKPVVGDWNGDGVSEVGIFRAGLWVIDYNGNGRWDGSGPDRVWSLGQAGDTPLVGDWNNDGKSKIAVFRAGLWVVDYNGSGGWDGEPGDRVWSLGQAGDTPVVGRWQRGQGHGIGVFRGLNPTQAMWLLDMNGNGRWDGDPTDRLRVFGQTGDTPVVAHWNSEASDKIGIFRAGLWILDYNGDGYYTPGIDRVSSLGQAGDKPLAGIW